MKSVSTGSEGRQRQAAPAQQGSEHLAGQKNPEDEVASHGREEEKHWES